MENKEKTEEKRRWVHRCAQKRNIVHVRPTKIPYQIRISDHPDDEDHQYKRIVFSEERKLSRKIFQLIISELLGKKILEKI